MEQWHDIDPRIAEELFSGDYRTILAPGMLAHGGVINCPDFHSDHFLGFLDRRFEKGTAVHLAPRTEPGRVLDGRAGKGLLYGDCPPFSASPLKSINEVYADSGDVNVLHVFHGETNLSKDNPLFTEEAIEKALGARGFSNVRHVPLYGGCGHDDMAPRDIVLDTKGGCIYVFPKEKSCYLRIPFF